MSNNGCGSEPPVIPTAFPITFTPLLVYQVLQIMSWRRAFELSGALGIVWATVFFWTQVPPQG